jgi:hypothetical protein
MGILTLVLWPLALTWAYLVPNKPLTGGTRPRPSGKTSCQAARIKIF